nr:EOG090X0F2L [Ilyocryptus agilis]
MLRRILLQHAARQSVGFLGRRNASLPATSTETPATMIADRQNTKVAPPEFRFIYPEFLPDPKMEWRNKLREKLERADMLKRRSAIDIPEFYTGSIMSVTVADVNSPNKVTRFVGICIQRGGTGLRAWFILRNVVDRQGIEILYQMYNPLIQQIQVLRLEKRLDDTLLYLRDCPPEYSTFPFDMEPEVRADSSVVPVNPIKVKLRPRPWLERWERQNLKGVEGVMDMVSQKVIEKGKKAEKPWEKYDLMLQYRQTYHAFEVETILAEEEKKSHHQQLKQTFKKNVGFTIRFYTFSCILEMNDLFGRSYILFPLIWRACQQGCYISRRSRFTTAPVFLSAQAP